MGLGAAVGDAFSAQKREARERPSRVNGRVCGIVGSDDGTGHR